MKATLYAVTWLLAFWAVLCLAQVLPRVIDDFKPASTNQPCKEYPQINSEGRVLASSSAPSVR
jgi:hypothetical protein